MQPDVADEDDKEVLEDLIAAALNDAVRKIEQSSQEKMGGMTAGMQLPPGSSCRSDRRRAAPGATARRSLLPCSFCFLNWQARMGMSFSP
jgi:hypothetical protein